MESKFKLNRRSTLKTAALGILGLSIPNLSNANYGFERFSKMNYKENSPKHFPNIDPELIAEVVGKSHFDLDRVKKLIGKRPELSKSVWEWRFGDFESAIGAASHVGRRDIALYLMNNGARPTIFTFAMLGAFQVVKSIILSVSGIQKITGPHGISLLDHAYTGRRMKDKMTNIERENLERTIGYLESLGDAGGEKYLDVSPEEQKRYLGDYKYGDGENEGFTISLNMRKILSLGPIGEFGGAIYKIGENKFTYNGAPSVTVSFNVQNEAVQSLTITDPDIKITAEKI